MCLTGNCEKWEGRTIKNNTFISTCKDFSRKISYWKWHYLLTNKSRDLYDNVYVLNEKNKDSRFEKTFLLEWLNT